MDSRYTQQEQKGHVKDSVNKLGNTVFLAQNEGQWLISKKTEKLTTAVYLVTDFLSEKESMKWELRSKALSLLSFIVSSLSGEHSLESGIFVKQAQKLTGDLLLFLELASRVNLVSGMNFSILKEEYISLNEQLRAHFKKEGLVHDVNFPDNLFREEKQAPTFGMLTSYPSAEYKGHSKRQNSDKRQTNITSYIAKNYVTRKKNKSERGELILRFIKTKGEVSIKDITSIISDCSEKTIQRELFSLISGGVLERKGERRWSTYLLKSHHAERASGVSTPESTENSPLKT